MRKVALVAKVAITLGLLGYVFSMIDPSAVFAQIKQSNPTILAAGTLVLGFQPLLGAARWQLILASIGVPLSFGSIVRCTYISVFFGQVLPAMVGTDALRVWLAHGAGCSLRTAVISVGLDRVALLLSLIVLIALGAPFLARLMEASQLLYLVPLLLGGSILGLALLMMGDRLPASLQRLRSVRAIGYLARDARGLFLRPKFACATMTLSLISYLSVTVSIYLFALAFDRSAHLLDFLVLVPPVLAASMLPISIGGWGTREVAMIAALGTVGIAADTAILASVWLGLASILIALPGAILYLVDRAPFKSAMAASSRSVNS